MLPKRRAVRLGEGRKSLYIISIRVQILNTHANMNNTREHVRCHE